MKVGNNMDGDNLSATLVFVVLIIIMIGAIVFISFSNKKRVKEIDDTEVREIIEQRNNKEEPKEEEKPLSTYTSFSIDYNTDSNIYHASLLETKQLYTKINETCTTNEGCTPLDREFSIELTDDEYKLIIDTYNKLYTSEWPKESKRTFTISLARIARNNEEMDNNNTNSWGMYEDYDTNKDGILTYKEYGLYNIKNIEY